MHAPLRSCAVTVLAATAACVAASPAAAAKPKVAHFEATVKGSQLIRWQYHRPPGGSCDASEDGTGEAYITYATPSDGDTRITVMQAGKDSPLYRLYKGRPALLPKAGTLEAGAILAMKGTHAVGGVDPSCPEDGGGGTEQPIGCDVSGGDYHLDLEFVRRNRLAISGRVTDGWGAPSGRSEAFLSTVFPNCPHWLGGPTGSDMLQVSEGHLPAIDEAFAEKRLFDRKRKTLTVRADVGSCYDENGEVACGTVPRPFSGTITTRWKLTLKRVKG